MNKQEALQKIEELKKFVEDCDKEEKWTPKIGEDYFYLDDFNKVNSYEYMNDEIDKDLIQSGNCFRTEALANSEKMRRESMKRDWFPKKGEEYWEIILLDNNGYFVKEALIFTGYGTEKYYLGRIKKTEAEAQNWIDTYGKYWVEKE